MENDRKEVMNMLHGLVDRYICDSEYVHINCFTHKALDLAPDYFWTRLASTSGKYHKGETLVEHVLDCLTFSEDVVRQMTEGFYSRIWSEEDIACFYSALILHDMFSSGIPGQERKREDGSLRTDSFHMIYPQFLLKDIKVKGKTAKECKWFKTITEAILYHYGPWNPITVLSIENLKCTDVRYQVHNVDFVVSRKNVRIVRS